ncbi:MAG TPA: sulfite exporter TauE/SafE family protein [Caulobacteraceae bacterium]|nr:sulfite exporter TauE/SafE family protein [Caulobacteraceae bacterium]
MGWAILAFLLTVIFATAVLTGVFGLAGGLVLMGVLALVLPVRAAFITHGLVQIVANGSRAVLHRKHIRWGVLGFYITGSVLAGIIVAAVSYAPSKPLLYLLLGLTPGLVWLPRKSLSLDAQRPAHAFVCGLTVTGLNLLAGVAGPLLDIFFVRTKLTRHQIVATKAATQVFSHLAKVVVYGAPLLNLGTGVPGMPPVWLFLVAAPLSILGAIVGGKILDRLTDKGFIQTTRILVTVIGAVYLAQAGWLYQHS